MLRLFAVLVIVAGLSAGGWWYWKSHSAPVATYRVTPIKRGDLLAAITATGTVEPEEVIDVGAQVAGLILSFGDDPDPAKKGKFIDYRTKVDNGTVLAHIDDSVYRLDVASAKAAYEQAQANVIRGIADLEQMKAKQRQAQRDWDRAKKLGPSDALSQTDYDLYQANFEAANAAVGVGASTLIQSEKAVEQADAALKKAQRNIDYCTITSPVKGEIIDRRVNTGQTVVASLNAPSLFLIAKDLTHMQVWAAVNEADIGSIHPGQDVTFTVDAVPFRTFKGEVGKIRYNAVMTQNVVNYTVEILTDNADNALMPYLTANVQFIKSQRHNVLTVPNTALRWTPRLEQVAPEFRDAAKPLIERRSKEENGSGSGGGGGDGEKPEKMSRPTTGPAGGPPVIAAPHGSRTHGTLWVTDGKEFVKPIKVQVGVTDGVASEVKSDEIAEKLDVVVGENQSAGSSPEGTNPFAPQMPRGGGRGR